MKRFLSLMLTIVLMHTAAVFSQGLAKVPSEKEQRFTEQVKAAIAKLGTGPAARVRLKLHGGRELKGYVSQINEDSFLLMDAKSGTLTAVAYAQVRQAQVHNSSTGKKIIEVVVGIVGAFLIIRAIG